MSILASTKEKNNGMIMANLANILVETKPEEAISLYHAYLAESITNNKKIHEIGMLTNLGYAYARIADYPKAFTYFEEALALSEQENLLDDQYNIFRLQSWVYEDMGNDEQALIYYRKYRELQEEVIGKQTQEKIAELKVQYETAAKEKALALQQEKMRNLQQETKIKRQQYLLFITLLLGMGSLISFVFYKRITERKSSDCCLQISEVKGEDSRF